MPFIGFHSSQTPMGYTSDIISVTLRKGKARGASKAGHAIPGIQENRFIAYEEREATLRKLRSSRDEQRA